MFYLERFEFWPCFNWDTVYNAYNSSLWKLFSELRLLDQSSLRDLTLSGRTFFTSEFLPNWMTYQYHRVHLPLRRAGDGICNPTPDGRQYLGHTYVTASGKVCQAWSSQSPHQHGFDEDDMFPDGSVEDASNYCRNPDIEWDEGLWCYTTDPTTLWESCNVPACGQSLRSIMGTFVEIKIVLRS